MRLFRNTLLGAVLLCIFQSAAAAQEPTPEYPPACDASKVTKGEIDRAHTVFLSGKQYLEESNYDKAISYFKDAYSIDCSVHPILPIIATAYERKGDKPAAIRALQEYIKRSPTAPDRDVVERRIKNLRDQLQPAPPQPTVNVTPTPVIPTPAPAPPPVAPPPEPNLPPQATPEAPDSSAVHHGVGPWIVVGAGGLAVATGIVLLAVGASDVSSAASSCPLREGCASDVASKGNSGRSLETGGVVVGAIGLGAAVAGLVWYAIEPSTTAPARALSAAPTVALAPGYANVGLTGSF